MAESINHDSRTVPWSVKANSRRGLTLAMLKISTKLKGRVIFQDIQQSQEDGRTVWIAWYYRTFVNNQDIKEFESDSDSNVNDEG